MKIEIKQYTKSEIGDVILFEKNLRSEEDFYSWDIGEEYISNVEKSFEDKSFGDSLSLLAYDGERVIGRVDSAMIKTHFDGSTCAYLDWICVLKSYRHNGVAQMLLEELKTRLKAKGIKTLIALTAANGESQSFYKAIPNSKMGDVGIWIYI